jgi:hypothetical protein
VDLFPLPFWQLFPPLLQSDQYRLRLLRQYRIATACKGAHGAIPAIASSLATPNAWRPRTVLMLIAGSIPGTRLRASGTVPIAANTEQGALGLDLAPTLLARANEVMNRDAVCCGA